MQDYKIDNLDRETAHADALGDQRTLDLAKKPSLICPLQIADCRCSISARVLRAAALMFESDPEFHFLLSFPVVKLAHFRD